MKLHIFSRFMLCIAMLSIIAVVTSCAGPTNGRSCFADMVQVGPLCVDKYEASVWSLPPSNEETVNGEDYGTTSDNYPCSDNGNDCASTASNPIYAASVPWKKPSAYITWFQAQQACFNVGKRLLTNAEWQAAAAGTPDPGGADDGDTTCNTYSNVVPAGSRENCVSNWGVFDMVGNLEEWVADWMQPNTGVDEINLSNPLYGGDEVAGINDVGFPDDGAGFPAVPVRGGPFHGHDDAGVFTINLQFGPSFSSERTGFRCAKPL